MNNFIFENFTKIYFGKGCVKEYLASLIREYQTVMLAYGGGSIKRNGIYDEILLILKREGKTIIEFQNILPNPTYQKVLEGAELARTHHVEIILAVGGGSVIDCCKAVSMAAVYRGDLWADYWERKGIVDFEPIPLGAVVTAAGAGSESNGTAVITNEECKIQTGRDYVKCSPRFALMDPSYTCSVPQRQAVSEGFDILSRIMETYFSYPDEDNVSDNISEALMGSVIRNLEALIEDPGDYTARSNLFWDSSMADNRIIQLGKQCDFQCHQMAHQLSAYRDCSHGEVLAVLHPVYYRHIYRAGLGKFVRFAEQIWNVPRERKSDDEMALAGIRALEHFIKGLGLPGRLRDLGFSDRSQLDAIADSCRIPGNSYKPITHREIRMIFQECF